MALSVKADVNVPLTTVNPFTDLTVTADAASATGLFLAEHGLDLTPCKEDKDVAAGLATDYAADPEKTSKKVTPAKVAAMRPASIVLADNILKEFSFSVVENSIQLRQLVTNKLIVESENPDARHRLRALELLGKISDVGLFAEKSEVTITHQSSDDLRARLRGKLEKLVDPAIDVEDAVIVDDSPDLLGLLGDEESVQYDDDWLYRGRSPDNAGQPWQLLRRRSCWDR